MNNMRAFSLIEVIIYTALLGVLITATFSTILPLMSALEEQNQSVNRTLEASFIEQKIRWMLSKKVTIENPSDNTSSSSLIIETLDHNEESIRLIGTSLFISSSTGPTLSLSRADSVIDFFEVIHSVSTTTGYENIEVMFSIDAIPFGPFHYDIF